MTILGLNAYHGDSAACLVVDGKLILWLSDGARDAMNELLH